MVTTMPDPSTRCASSWMAPPPRRCQRASGWNRSTAKSTASSCTRSMRRRSPTTGVTNSPPWDEWVHYVYDRPGEDYALWILAFDDQGLAGYSINRQLRPDDPTFAWIGTLGVLARARRRGLGDALLRTSFARFHERGYTRAGLGVDAENTTNALALYERAGMYAHRTTLSYLKELRPAEG
ncbi:MAG: GNAT family N-acetyltransferase [Chloroflexi bacterium]|nr:GNAT family N-acetyltransferase [Chloroflexota bacterium]